jgi:hypothetical protein
MAGLSAPRRSRPPRSRPSDSRAAREHGLEDAPMASTTGSRLRADARPHPTILLNERSILRESLADDRAIGVSPQLQAALLQGLTAEQAHTVTYGAGPLLIIAGPGAGKTTTLIHRIAWLLAWQGAEPWETLAVTFSVRAAGELRFRLADLLGEQVAAAVTAATFHSVCARMLREEAAFFGRTGDYTIYDQADMRHVIE